MVNSRLVLYRFEVDVLRKQMHLWLLIVLGIFPTLCQAGPLADKVFGYCGWQSLSGTVSIQYAYDGVTNTPRVGEFYFTDDGYIGMRAMDDSWHEIIHNGEISEKLVGVSPSTGTDADYGPLACFSKVASITQGAEDGFNVRGEAGQTLTLTAQDMESESLVINVDTDGRINGVQVQGFAGASMDLLDYGTLGGARFITGWRINRQFAFNGELHQLAVITRFSNVSVNPGVQNGAWGEP
jgi:hypothetical protein